MKTILLADDEECLRLLVHATLNNRGYRIVQAADGEEALALARSNRPDLLILDWMMPRMRGLEVAQILRSEPATANVPIIMLTARCQQSDRAKAAAARIDAFLVKPFGLAELIAVVNDKLKGPSQRVAEREDGAALVAMA